MRGKMKLAEAPGWVPGLPIWIDQSLEGESLSSEPNRLGSEPFHTDSNNKDARDISVTGDRSL
jgi:hypothetical protein